MRRGESGSVLILALVTVALASMLAVGAAAALRSALAEVGARRQAAHDANAAFACAEAFARDVLAVDTNGIDHAGEAWRQPFPKEDSRGVPSVASFLAPEFPDIDAAPCADEESRLPLNSAPEGAIAALVAARTGRPVGASQTIAAEIAALRPIPRREFLMRAPSLKAEDYAAIAPFVTAAPSEVVNLNTAPRPVLEAMFEMAGDFRSGAARSLSRKILDFCAAGGHLESLDPDAIAADVGGIDQGEANALRAASPYLTLQSRHFSAVARSGRAAVAFTYDRDEGAFRRVAVLPAGTTPQ